MEASEIKGKHEMFGVLATGRLTCLVFHAIARFSRGDRLSDSAVSKSYCVHGKLRRPRFLSERGSGDNHLRLISLFEEDGLKSRF